MAGRRDDPNDEFAVLSDHERRLRRLERSPQIGFTSIDEGSLRVASADGLIVEGSARVSGVLLVTGTENVDGTLSISGHLIVSGDMNVTGPTVISGTFQVDGETTINGHTVVNGNMDVNGQTVFNGDMDVNGALDLSGTLTVTGGGKIQAGVVVIDGTSGGRIAAPGATLSLVATEITTTGGFRATNNALVEGNLTVLGNTILTLNTTSNPANVYYDEASGQLRYNP